MDYLDNKAELDALADKVVYTGAIDAYFDYKLGTLEYRSVRFETETLDKPNFQGNAAVNYTDRETPWTRIIEHKWFEFGKDEDGNELPKTVISREFSSEWKTGDEPYYPVNDEKNGALYNVTVDYAFQDINDIPGVLPEGRTKPWGTGQAVLAAKDVLTTPFIVINADDYYGKEGFRAVHEYLVNGGQSCMAGFVLKNTLSDNGGVTRGICKMDAENNLTEVVETKNIIKTTEGAEADGMKLDIDSLVSMNMWGLTPDFLKTLEEGFKEFFEKEVPANPLKAEYLIPTFIGELLSEGKISVKALRTNDTWYGMTYKEDVAAVKESFSKMLENGTYKGDLFSDL